MKKFKIAIFASGSGSNAEAIFNYFQHHRDIEVVLLLSNKPDAYALQRAAKFNVPTNVFDKETFRSAEIVLNWLKEKEVTHIVLAGFLWLVPDYLIQSYPNQIINIHPALLPKYGGSGMYGMKVHEAVKAAAERESGITIHVVNEHYDEGKVLFQATCVVSEIDTPNTIANKIHELEHKHFPVVIEKWIKGDL